MDRKITTGWGHGDGNLEWEWNLATIASGNLEFAMAMGFNNILGVSVEMRNYKRNEPW